MPTSTTAPAPTLTLVIRPGGALTLLPPGGGREIAILATPKIAAFTEAVARIAERRSAKASAETLA